MINKPKNEYDKINNLINSNNSNIDEYANNNSDENIENKSSLNINNIDSEHIKSELKDFFNELNNNASNNSAEANNLIESFSDSKYASMF